MIGFFILTMVAALSAPCTARQINANVIAHGTYSIGSPNLIKGDTWVLHVVSQGQPVDAIMVNDRNYSKYLVGEDYDYLGSSSGITDATVRLRSPMAGQYWLILSNKQGEQAAPITVTTALSRGTSGRGGSGSGSGYIAGSGGTGQSGSGTGHLAGT